MLDSKHVNCGPGRRARTTRYFAVKIQIIQAQNIIPYVFHDILYIIINILPRCMERSRSDGVSVEVPSQYCDPAEKPIEEEACHLFCSNECVLSEWSSWTSCSHTVIKIVC